MTCKPCQAAQMVKQGLQAAFQVATGQVAAVSQDVQQQRLEICKTCPQLQRFHQGLPESADIGLLDRCSCGCVLRAKSAFEFNCPLGKWDKI